MATEQPALNGAPVAVDPVELPGAPMEPAAPELQKPVVEALSKHNVNETPLTPPRTPTLSKTSTPTQTTTVEVEDSEASEESEDDEDDSAPASNMDSTATTPPVQDDDLSPSLQAAHSLHLARLAETLTALARDHDASVSHLYESKIAALQSRIAASEHAQKDLAAQLATERSERAQETQASAEATQALLQRKDEELARAVDAVRDEMAAHAEERVKLVMEDMQAQMEERVRAAREEVAILGDEKIAAIKEEMLTKIRSLQAEIARSVESEKGALERARRAELGRRGDDKLLNGWAVAKLWGVGNSRSRRSRSDATPAPAAAPAAAAAAPSS